MKNLNRILEEIPTIAGVDIREVFNRFPKLISSNCDCLKESILEIKKSGIPDSSMNKCLQVLTLGPSTINQRLSELKSIGEFDVLRHNSRILRLIQYQIKAKKRLEFLGQIKVKCASLHILTSPSEAFKKLSCYNIIEFIINFRNFLQIRS